MQSIRNFISGMFSPNTGIIQQQSNIEITETPDHFICPLSKKMMIELDPINEEWKKLP